jgi:Domain of unknown function (DUF397)
MEWIRSTKCDGGSCLEAVVWQRGTKCDNAACAEVAWATSTKCETGACVEAHEADGMIGVRNSQIPGEIVWFDRDEWRAFREGILAGEFAFDA